MSDHFSPEAIAAALAEEFPASAVKMRSDGRQSFAYIEGHTAIHRLNKATGNDWSFKVEAVQFFGDEACIATGLLTIPGLGARGDIGTAAINRTKDGRLLDDSLKGAVTDCLKRCARQFGVALYLYGEDYGEDTGEPERYTPPAQQRNSFRDGTPVHVDERRGSADSGPSDRQMSFIRQLSHERNFTDVRFDKWLQEVYGLPLEGLTRQDASGLIERLKDPDSDFGPSPTPAQTSAPQTRGRVRSIGEAAGDRPPSTSATSSTPQARTQEATGGQSEEPITENQQKMVFAVGKNELQIEVDSDQFNDMTVLQWGAPWRELTKRQAMQLIDFMKKEPEKLDATQLPKDAKLGEKALRWWLQRISNAQDESEAAEIHRAMKNRYNRIEPEHAEALAVVLARWNIGVQAPAA
jgi:hypothetical protein